jgi:hypothetical protein
MAVTDIKKGMDAAGHDWPTVRRAAGRSVLKSDGSGAGVVSASRPGEWAPLTVFDFKELMRRAGVTDQ